jgi:hypothetical protein
VDIRLSAVPILSNVTIPVPYLLSNGKRALLVVGNPTDRDVDVVLRLTAEHLSALAGTMMFEVTDLWPTEQAPRRMTLEELSEYACTVSADDRPGGGLHVVRLERIR